MSSARYYQGGSTVSFIIIAAVIAAVLLGGIVMLRHRGEVVREQRANEIARQQEDKGPARPDEMTSNQPSSNKAPTDQNNGATSKPSPSPSPSSNKQNPTSEVTSGHGAPAATSHPASLPETGPVEVLVSLIAIAALAYAVASYIVSRRELVRATIA